MPKILSRILVSLILLSGCCFHAAAQENFEVRKVEFKGNKTLKKDFLLGGMAVKEVSYFDKKINKKEPYLYGRELMDLDLERLIRIYQSEGFLEAKATLLPLQINEKKKTLKLVIEIEEGRPVLIDSITFRLGEKLENVAADSLLKKVTKKLELDKGTRFRDESVNLDVQLIANAFQNVGYAYVKVKYDLSLKPGDYVTGIFYSIDPGPVCLVGATSISGNVHVSEKFIRKQLKYKEGEVYNKSMLTKTRQNLYNLQLFRVVSVLPETNPVARKETIPVTLTIKEAPRLSTRFGVGYGTEDKFRTFLDLNYLGFLSGARRINLYIKHSALLPYSVSLRWIQPRFWGDKSSITFNPFINRSAEPGYETRTYGINIPVTYRFNEWLNSTLTYYYENVKQNVEANDPEFTDLENNKFLYNKSGLMLSNLYDNSTPKFSATKGVNISIGFKLNGFLFGGDYNYTRLWGAFRTYYTIGDITLAFRVMAGGISSADTSNFIPVEDRFYSGGSTSIRGWNRSGLGPRRESGTPLGGKSILETSFEVRYPLFWRLSGAVFIDAGNVWTQSYTYHIDQLGYAVGPGLRLESPIGPVRFDVGFPVWNDKKRPHFFISVGQAF